MLTLAERYVFAGYGVSHIRRRVPIGLYRDVWIAAIASSRKRLASLTGAMCKTSQCELRSLRVNSGMLNGNGDFAIKAY